jgi:hypothetical protein
MIYAVLLLVGMAAGVAVSWPQVRLLRTELNSARANEQLLLTRLASRSPAEFHAVTEVYRPPTAAVPDNSRYLYDDTGLIEVVVPSEDR